MNQKEFLPNSTDLEIFGLTRSKIRISNTSYARALVIVFSALQKKPIKITDYQLSILIGFATFLPGIPPSTFSKNAEGGREIPEVRAISSTSTKNDNPTKVNISEPGKSLAGNSIGNTLNTTAIVLTQVINTYNWQHHYD